MSQWKVGIMGLGHVGAHVLQSVALQGYADDFVLYDLESNRAKAEAERQDVLDCMEFLPHRIDIKVGGIEDLADRDVIVNAVGDILALKGTHDRNYELKFNMHALYTYAEKLKASGFHGIVVNISNPCDVITWNLSEILGLPAGHVFGTGTGLDTARLKLRLQQQTGLPLIHMTADPESRPLRRQPRPMRSSVLIRQRWRRAQERAAGRPIMASSVQSMRLHSQPAVLYMP